MESELHTAVASERSGHGTAFCLIRYVVFGAGVLLLPFFLGRMGKKWKESGKRGPTEDLIERSKVHWSQLSEAAFDLDDDGAAEMDNMEVFENLRFHSNLGHFFKTFGSYDFWNSEGWLEVGEKFAEGGQAELFHAKIVWRNPEENGWDAAEGIEWVLKVFKKGTWLRHLQSQWPLRYLEWRANCTREFVLQEPARNHCDVVFATLLEDGRFAFLMQKEDEDLRSIIDCNMQMNTRKNHGPFWRDFWGGEVIMYQIALGMDWLHTRDIVHRDLKASNVLVTQARRYGEWICFVADFECSIGVVGTGFWRAPEILQAIKEKEVLQRPHIFSKEADVYAFGMTCYEILTGKLPFEGHPLNDYDLILNGTRPKVPEYIDDWAHGLLNGCWHSNPANRPSFRNILNVLEVNSSRVRWFKRYVRYIEFVRSIKVWIHMKRYGRV